jgi:hypothetical protein
MQKHIKHGWFSKEHSKQLNSVVYSTPNNSEVEVTYVDKEKECPNYMWDDKVYIGEVVEFLYENPGPNPFKSFKFPTFHYGPGILWK